MLGEQSMYQTRLWKHLQTFTIKALLRWFDPTADNYKEHFYSLSIDGIGAILMSKKTKQYESVDM